MFVKKVKVQKLGSNPHNSKHSSFVKIEFNPKVTKYIKLSNYNMYNYLVDVGSSLGLWLGLSVLTLYDAGLSFCQILRAGSKFGN